MGPTRYARQSWTPTAPEPQFRPRSHSACPAARPGRGGPGPGPAVRRAGGAAARWRATVGIRHSPSRARMLAAQQHAHVILNRLPSRPHPTRDTASPRQPTAARCRRQSAAGPGGASFRTWPCCCVGILPRLPDGLTGAVWRVGNACWSNEAFRTVWSPFRVWGGSIGPWADPGWRPTGAVVVGL